MENMIGWVVVVCMALSVLCAEIKQRFENRRTAKAPSRTNEEAEAAAIVLANRELETILAAQRFLASFVRRKHFSRPAMHENTRRTALAMKRADPKLLLKALKHGHDKANSAAPPERQLVWPATSGRENPPAG